MLDAVFVLARIAQYAAAVVLFGSPLFFLYGLPTEGSAAAAGLGWPRPLLAIASAVLLAGAVAGLAALAAVAFGRPSPALWGATGLMGAAALASFAWTGHGASDEGLAGGLHLASDVVHLLAAGVWLGALPVLALLLFSPSARAEPTALEALHRGLAGFSGVGTATVAALVASGLVNSWFLVGPRHVGDLVATPWGLLLCAKVVVFVGMLGLAGLNRFRLTPALERSLADPAAALKRLRLSVAIETGAGVAVLVLVGVLGTLAPPSAG